VGFDRFPNPLHSFAGFLRNGGCKITHHPLFQLWPELQQRHRTIETDIECFVVRIVVALHEGIYRALVRAGSDGASVERAEISKPIEFVEEHAAIPEWLRFVIDVTALPCVDRVAPRSGILQSVAGDRPRIQTGSAIKVGVAAIPLATGAELNDR